MILHVESSSHNCRVHVHHSIEPPHALAYHENKDEVNETRAVDRDQKEELYRLRGTIIYTFVLLVIQALLESIAPYVPYQKQGYDTKACH